MSLHPARCPALISLAIAGLAACAGPAPDPEPDAAPMPAPTVPITPAGVFTLTSTFDLRLPAAAEPAIAMLTAATDGPDDPTRYVVDQMIEQLPDGTVKAIAAAAAPFIAAYVNAQLVEIAPRFVAGLDGIATGVSRIATHLGTLETLQIAEDGTGIRTLTGVRFEVGGAATAVRFGDAGLADLSAGVRATLDATGRLAISEHAHGLPYGAIVRLGLARAVVPGVAPAARDLADALGMLLDCNRLGAAVADSIGLGTAALYGEACRAAMAAIASEIDRRLAAIDGAALAIQVAGTASGLDRDGDGTIDELGAGRWTGAIHAGPDRERIDASFSGAADRR